MEYAPTQKLGLSKFKNTFLTYDFFYFVQQPNPTGANILLAKVSRVLRGLTAGDDPADGRTST